MSELVLNEVNSNNRMSEVEAGDNDNDDVFVNGEEDKDEGFCETTNLASNDNNTDSTDNNDETSEKSSSRRDSMDSIMEEVRAKQKLNPKGEVRNKIDIFKKIMERNDSISNRDFEEEEKDKCVLYVTSISIVRDNFENCKQVRAILTQHFIDFDERDIYLNRHYRKELLERHGNLQVPLLFVDGKLFADYEKIVNLNESRQLADILSRFKIDLANPNRNSVCSNCGGARHVPCDRCSGSRRSQIRHYENDSIILRCSKCAASGIVRCPSCCPPSTQRSIIIEKN